MKGYLFGLLMVVIALFLQTTTQLFVSNPSYKPDIVLVIVIWASTRLDFKEGLLFSFSAGLLTDSLSGSPAGLFACLYCVTFLVCGYLDSTTDLDSHAIRFLVAFIVCIVESLSIIVIRFMAAQFKVDLSISFAILTKGFFTGIAATAVIPIVDRLWVGRTRLSGLHR